MSDNTIVGVIGGIIAVFIVGWLIIWVVSGTCEQAIRASRGNIDQIAWHCHVLLPKLVESIKP